MPQAQFGKKVRWLHDAYMETRKWNFEPDGEGGYTTTCPSCGDDFHFSEADGYTFKIGEPALTVEPDILCPKPTCDGAIHVYYRDVVLLHRQKDTKAVVSVTAPDKAADIPADKRNIVERVREKIGAGRPR